MGEWLLDPVVENRKTNTKKTAHITQQMHAVVLMFRSVPLYTFDNQEMKLIKFFKIYFKHNEATCQIWSESK